MQIVACTASVTVEDKNKIIASHFDGYLGKPIKTSELKKVMAAHFHD